MIATCWCLHYAARTDGRGTDPTSTPSRPSFPSRMGSGRCRPASNGDFRLSASGRGEHRPQSCEAVASCPQAHGANSVSRGRACGGGRSRGSRALPPSFFARPLDQWVPSSGWQHRASSAELQCHDRHDGSRHRFRDGSRPCAFLHLAT